MGEREYHRKDRLYVARNIWYDMRIGDRWEQSTEASGFSLARVLNRAMIKKSTREIRNDSGGKGAGPIASQRVSFYWSQR